MMKSRIQFKRIDVCRYRVIYWILNAVPGKCPTNKAIKDYPLFCQWEKGVYAPHFKKIGERYGPFDLAMIECDQYYKRWIDIHMFPEETALAGINLKAKQTMPIHWGGFKLVLHDWTDLMERVVKKAKELNVKLLLPQMGKPIFLSQPAAFTRWWEDL
ncbi:MAG: MBL fold metallo-hydrolase [Bacteroidota bacterium]